jgi:chemotaxis methyl-accepting protein methylase
MSVNYGGYQVRQKSQAPRSLAYRLARAAYRLLKVKLLYNTLLLPYGKLRHTMVKRDVVRTQSHTYTCFFRAPAQLEALAGQVVDRLLQGAPADRRLDILVFAASTGAEAYTVASFLRKARPGLDFRIVASDLHQEMADRGNAGKYSRAEVWHSEYITEEFVRDTFDTVGEEFVVKPELRARVTFTTANLLDPGLHTRFPAADIVLAQNVLFHLDDAAAANAFEHIISCLKPRAALLIEGMNLDQKVRLSGARGLEPLAYRCREIYEQSRVHVPLDWWNYYYGSEPYISLYPGRDRRYSSIYFNGVSTSD